MSVSGWEQGCVSVISGREQGVAGNRITDMCVCNLSHYLAPGGGLRGIEITLSVCLYVCLCVCVSDQ